MIPRFLSRRFMRNKILVISSKFDEHADYIINLLNIRGMSERVIRLNTEDFRTNVKYLFDGKHFIFRICDSEITFSETDISTVWYRRPVDEKLELSDEGVKHFIKGQVCQFLNGFYYNLHEDTLWINDLRADMFSKNKLFQLKIANRVGFYTPEVIISNDYKHVQNFFFDNEMVCNKSLSTPRYTYNGQQYAYMTRITSREDLESNLQSLDACPTFFEEYIKKEYDIRVVVIGKHIFPFAIYSQENEFSKVDVRGLSPLKLRHEFIKLPKDIEDKILKFMKIQNLFFSSMDFVYSKDKKYYFIENNCNGQWIWLENITGVDISSTFIKELLREQL